MISKLLPSKLKRKIKLVLHAGEQFECPFCGYAAKDLAAIGIDVPVLREKQVVGAGLRMGGCHSCGSIDRERLVYIYLREVLKVFENKGLNILHLAPEVNVADRLRQVGFVNYVCGDLFTEGYSYPDYVQNMNVLNIPFEDGLFDLVICNHLLEHVPNDRDAMRELHRVLKPGGKAILLVPISLNSSSTFEDASVTNSKDRESIFGQFDHVRIYGQDYADRLGEVGFKVERLNISKDYSKYGLNEDEDLFIGVK